MVDFLRYNVYSEHVNIIDDVSQKTVLSVKFFVSTSLLVLLRFLIVQKLFASVS